LTCFLPHLLPVRPLLRLSPECCESSERLLFPEYTKSIHLATDALSVLLSTHHLQHLRRMRSRKWHIRLRLSVSKTLHGWLVSPSFVASAAASAAARGNEQGSDQDRQVLIEYTEQPQALSEQETEATPSAGHPFGSSQEFVRGPPLNQEFMLACMGRLRETMQRG